VTERGGTTRPVQSVSYYSASAPKVLQAAISPSLSPFRNQRFRCSEVSRLLAPYRASISTPMGVGVLEATTFAFISSDENAHEGH
jgi:hypothetical protein